MLFVDMSLNASSSTRYITFTFIICCFSPADVFVIDNKPSNILIFLALLYNKLLRQRWMSALQILVEMAPPAMTPWIATHVPVLRDFTAYIVNQVRSNH